MNNEDTIFELFAQEKRIGHHVHIHGPLPKIEGAPSTFEALCKSIVSQQLSITAADTIYKRYYALMMEEAMPERVLSYHPDDFRAIGLSYQKANYVQEVARFWNNNSHLENDLQNMGDEEIIKTLTQIKGVGEWTVHMLLIFHFQRPNVLPLGDLIVRKGIIYFYEIDPTSKNILELCKEATEHWQPFASYGSRYMWALKDKIIL
jgi:DNA-3-methyladenine glycosylase II